MLLTNSYIINNPKPSHSVRYPELCLCVHTLCTPYISFSHICQKTKHKKVKAVEVKVKEFDFYFSSNFI